MRTDLGPEFSQLTLLRQTPLDLPSYIRDLPKATPFSLFIPMFTAQTCCITLYHLQECFNAIFALTCDSAHCMAQGIELRRGIAGARKQLNLQQRAVQGPQFPKQLMIVSRCSFRIVEGLDHIFDENADCYQIADRETEWDWHDEAAVRRRKRLTVRLEISGSAGAGSEGGILFWRGVCSRVLNELLEARKMEGEREEVQNLRCEAHTAI
jgi:hypothetical protein